MDYARLNNYKSLYQMKIQEIKKTTVHVEELLYLYIHTRRVKYQTRLQSKIQTKFEKLKVDQRKISRVKSFFFYISFYC